MDNKYSKSRLPRMSVGPNATTVSSVGRISGDTRRSIDSTIGRTNKTLNNNNNNLIINNNNELINSKVVFCRPDVITYKKSVDRNNGTKNDSNCQMNENIKTLCKSLSLDEIQSQNNGQQSMINVFSNDCDSQKAFSYEQLDDNYTDNMKNYLTKDNSDLNLMEMSIDESSTASLGLLPNILSPISPLDTFGQNIPFLSIDSQLFPENNINNIEINEDDDDSQSGIPTIQEYDSDMTINNISDSNITVVLASNYNNNIIEIDEQIGPQEMVEELESLTLDNSMTLRSQTDNESNNMSIESNDNNISETNIPMNDEVSKNSALNNNDLNANNISIKPLSPMSDIPMKIANNLINDNKSLKPVKSCPVRPMSLNTKAVLPEKVQRAASPSGKAPVPKRFKTPGRWDAVMNKIEKSKTSVPNNTIIKGKINTNRKPVPNESLSKISPSDEQLVSSNSSHLSLSNVSIKSNAISSTANSLNNSKVNIPKSKTFVRDFSASVGSGSRSQQPVPTSKPSIPVTPMSTQASQQIIDRTESKSGSQTIRKDNKGFVSSANDKKTANRKLNQTKTTITTTSVSVATKRMTGTKISASNTNNTSKRDVRNAQVVDDKQRMQKLSHLCENKTKQLKSLTLEQNYTRLAFDSLSVVIQHLIEQYEPFENPKLKQALNKANLTCEQLKDNLVAKNTELNDMKIIFEEQINQMMKEREKNYHDLNELKVSHELNVKKLKEIHSSDVKNLEEMFRKELTKIEQNCDQLMSQIEEKDKELTQTKQTKETLENRLKKIETNIMSDKDKRFKYLTDKSKQLELEVESLKVVMDMKNEKIHTLERKMIETQEKINELPYAKETIRSLQQQVETLQVTLDRKIHQYNQLTREHHDLQELYEQEMREKRRLSMKNEELAFHLSESYNESNNCSPLDVNHFRFKSPAISIDETPIKTNRSPKNINSVQNDRKSISHSKVNRSISMNSSTRTTSSVCKRLDTTLNSCSTNASNNENNLLSNNCNLTEMFNRGNNITERLKKDQKLAKFEKLAKPSVFDETPPQCILDSGFEEIQGLNSLSK
ncbi:putative uncharacterized protein DDB_G0277255 [Oppia nitens]|uniref:putative uncharacterized protein DDB_G0277255 n=1 Tax=Oppia nitens TaxID=1686743 RepID=UPI0023DC53FE|nr:putative uncharacterized protein DDB_G0277255 [Oppia nitens]